MLSVHVAAREGRSMEAEGSVDTQKAAYDAVDGREKIRERDQSGTSRYWSRSMVSSWVRIGSNA